MGKILSWLETAFSFTMAAFTGILVILACYQVTARYFLGWGITWTEETMRYIFVATIMLGIYFVSKSSGFATLTLVYDLVAARSKRAGAILSFLQYVVQLIFYALLFYYGVKLCLMSFGRVSTAMHTSFALIYLPLPIGGFMGFVNILLRCINEFRPRAVGNGEKA